jgi:hypothetical protein
MKMIRRTGTPAIRAASRLPPTETTCRPPVLRPELGDHPPAPLGIGSFQSARYFSAKARVSVIG